MRKICLLVPALLVLTVACSSPTEGTTPLWLWKVIVEFQSQPVSNPPQSIWEYEFEGKTVYYIPAQCCDMFASLYDAEGTLICAPNGGIDGRGDGRCPNFLSERTNERLVWEDSRAR